MRGGRPERMRRRRRSVAASCSVPIDIKKPSARVLLGFGHLFSPRLPLLLANAAVQKRQPEHPNILKSKLFFHWYCFGLAVLYSRLFDGLLFRGLRVVFLVCVTRHATQGRCLLAESRAQQDHRADEPGEPGKRGVGAMIAVMGLGIRICAVVSDGMVTPKARRRLARLEHPSGPITRRA
ncbi:hypothetical protein B0T25DRAFT_189838 [Lasiosphaeria hispida]|uniref:Uncharacterized protein n=1 Tax=Lasiosphaeria hispida TaxID=260671 RepID=A0AAJ0MDN8_9PEZI|nr:hypothetical protein B0T25DRAFT_189838 [Lasiosphaeria hispida]